MNGTLIKLSANGDIVWQKAIAHPVSDNAYFARNILPTNDGGCIVVGERKEPPQNWNSSIAKFAPGGALQWSKTYDFLNASGEDITAIAATNGGYVFSGNGLNNLTFKIDTLGNVLWANNYGVDGARSKTIINDANGNIVFTGSNIYSDTSQYAYIVKLNSSGNVIFGKTYHSNAQMNDITLTADGYCAIGTTDPEPFNPPDNVYILKTDFSGNIGGNCTTSAIAVTKIPRTDITIKESRLKITPDTYTASNITLTASVINNLQQDWCGTISAPLSKSAMQPYNSSVYTKTFKAYTNLAAKRVDVLYNDDDFTTNAKYEVILYNSNGIAIAKKPLHPNIPITISMAQQMPALYLIVLEKEGQIIERKNVIWAR